MRAAHRPIPRGIARSGPVLLSYGFRPFFLGAGVFALVSMVTWMGALGLGWEVGGSYGILNWHAHEMLFGYMTAALAGFMLTAVPNWTGRLPVSGTPLLALVLLWLAGRLCMAFPDLVGLPVAIILDALFLFALALVASIEIMAGRNWKNLKILFGLFALFLANLHFHGSVLLTGSGVDAVRPGVSVYLMLIALVGGRIIPSFSRNWLVKAGRSPLPSPFGRFDTLALALLLVALVAWSIWPAGWPIATLCWLAALAQAARLLRWRGHAVLDEPMLLALHVAYAFIPIGLVGSGLAALGVLSSPSALHLLLVGALGGMTLAVMMRASLGHTGRPPVANTMRSVALLALALSAVIRPFAEILPDDYHLILVAAGTLWCLAYGLYCIEFVPILGGTLSD